MSSQHHVSAALCPCGRCHLYTLGGSQRLSGCGGKEKNLCSIHRYLLAKVAVLLQLMRQ